MSEWRDISSHSRNDADRSPKTVEYVAGRLHICVTRHIHMPGRWVLMAEPFMNFCQLSAIELDDAKREALDIIRKHVSECLAALEAQ